MYYKMYYFLEQVRKDQCSIIKTIIEHVNDFEKDEDNIVKLGKNQVEDIHISGDRQQIGIDEYVGQGVMKGDATISCSIRCKQRRRV